MLTTGRYRKLVTWGGRSIGSVCSANLNWISRKSAKENVNEFSFPFTAVMWLLRVLLIDRSSRRHQFSGQKTIIRLQKERRGRNKMKRAAVEPQTVERNVDTWWKHDISVCVNVLMCGRFHQICVEASELILKRCFQLQKKAKNQLKRADEVVLFIYFLKFCPFNQTSVMWYLKIHICWWKQLLSCQNVQEPLVNMSFAR